MLIRTRFIILCLACLTLPALAEEPTKYKPIDAKTIEAYEHLGAGYGEFVIDAYFCEPWVSRTGTVELRVC